MYVLSIMRKSISFHYIKPIYVYFTSAFVPFINNIIMLISYFHFHRYPMVAFYVDFIIVILSEF